MTRRESFRRTSAGGSTMLRRIVATAFAAAVPLASSFASEPAPSRSLPLEERVDATRGVERGFWNRRTWPAENPGPKPSLAEALPDSVLRERVRDTLRKTNALATIWGRKVTTSDLDAEMRRMAEHTKAPETLRALYAAL